MVLLAKWLLEHDPDARILVVTDRDELDKQIEGVMKNAGVIGPESPSPRIASRAEFVRKLGSATPRLLCALIHKFDPTDLNGPPPPLHGRFYVFVDECHRTQGGDMNGQMKRWLESAIFVGFTGTPLLRQDKQMTRDVFGTYIHTYKFQEGVADGVILDLKYQARDVPQRLTSRDAIDRWFEQKTRGLNNFQKAVLRKRWATMEELMSAGERKQRIIASIVEDFWPQATPEQRPGHGDPGGGVDLRCLPLLSALPEHGLRPVLRNRHVLRAEPQRHFARTGRTAMSATSSTPTPSTYSSMARPRSSTKTRSKRRFIEEPANLKLLIVVSKLLTGFDAPSCTYIYLDHELHDHNLFQAICRTNRLDGDDKDYGYIVDFKELFGDVQKALAVYSSDELDTDDGGGGDNNVRLKDWLVEGKKRLEEAREALHYLCEPVPLPREVEQYLQHFCGDAANPLAFRRWVSSSPKRALSPRTGKPQTRHNPQRLRRAPIAAEPLLESLRRSRLLFCRNGLAENRTHFSARCSS